MDKKKNMPAKSEAIGNKDNELSEDFSVSLIEGVLQSVNEEFNLSKRLQIGLLHHSGYSNKVIAGLVKSTEPYVRNSVAICRRDQKLRRKLFEIIESLPQWFRRTSQSRLPILQAGLNEAAKLYLKEPQQILERPQALKLMLKTAGVQTDEERTVQTINIEKMIAIQQHIHAQQQTPRQVEGEIVDIEETE